MKIFGIIIGIILYPLIFAIFFMKGFLITSILVLLLAGLVLWKGPRQFQYGLLLGIPVSLVLISIVIFIFIRSTPSPF